MQVEAAQHVEDEPVIGDGLSDVTEAARERFLTLTIRGDGEAALDESSEFSLKVESPSFHVVTEESFGTHPHVTSGLVGFHDDVQDGAVHPRENREVTLSPIKVIGLSIGVANMGKEMKLVDHGEEEGLPFGVVRCLQIETHMDLRLDNGHIDSRVGGS